MKGQKMRNEDEETLERVSSEEEDAESSPASFEVITYPADYTLEGIVAKYRKGSIFIPGFERKFVWTINQASRLIESFLLGLPVPAIFLYLEPETNKFVMIDGQQRLLSIYYFMEGYFGEPNRGNRAEFQLKGLNKSSPFYEKKYENLKESNEAAFNKLNDSVLRAFIVKQIDPEGSSSVFHIFERLNTGGTPLVGQEIRNCIYHGEFKELLAELNNNKGWREIFGKQEPDKRQRDVELILRFFALYCNSQKYGKPMKDFLSNFMSDNRHGRIISIEDARRLFDDTVSLIRGTLGPRPFHFKSGLNAAAFDCVSIAFAKNRHSIPHDLKDRFSKLKAEGSFLKSIEDGTTDEVVVARRIMLSENKLFG
ncbi:MAG: DUF262 domain-containing protein [Deltaproteobacteria bacterium]|nr:DUF262 domain-containing protein [Deltaproteobacteria bacterium]